MTTNIVDLREFYQTPLGEKTRFLLRKRVQALWPDVSQETILGLGYATPLLRPWLDVAKLVAFMPPAQGGAYWPRERSNLVALAEMDKLPLDEESVHRVIALHALENAPNPQAFLQEIWRVLKGNGRALIIVPHRRGLWAHKDSTPFGTGQPYSARQLRALFKAEGFVIHKIQGALYLPPVTSRLLLGAAEKVESIAAPLFPGLGGLLVIEVCKQMFAPLMTPLSIKKPRLILPVSFPMGGPIPT